MGPGRPGLVTATAPLLPSRARWRARRGFREGVRPGNALEGFETRKTAILAATGELLRPQRPLTASARCRAGPGYPRIPSAAAAGISARARPSNSRRSTRSPNRPPPLTPAPSRSPSARGDPPPGIRILGAARAPAARSDPCTGPAASRPGYGSRNGRFPGRPAAGSLQALVVGRAGGADDRRSNGGHQRDLDHRGTRTAGAPPHMDVGRLAEGARS